MKKLSATLMALAILSGTATADNVYQIGDDFTVSGQVIALGGDGIGIQLDRPISVNNQDCDQACGSEKGLRINAETIQVSWNHERYRELTGRKGSHQSVKCTLAGAWDPGFKTDFVCAELAD